MEERKPNLHWVPDEPEREMRVCLRVVPRKGRFAAGVFCRASSNDPYCYGVNQPLIWLILNSDVDKVCFFVCLMTYLYIIISMPRAMLARTRSLPMASTSSCMLRALVAFI